MLSVPRYSQLKHHLKGLKRDSDKLKALVAKYEKIHDEGPGRRMLFAIKESSGLTDLRRRIGLHEQMLEMWYMTLVYGSLRRLEGGQEDILRAIEAMKNWSSAKKQRVRSCVRQGNSKPLEDELNKSGLDPTTVLSALPDAVEYVNAQPLEQVRMESRAKSSKVKQDEGGSFSRSRFRDPSFGFDRGFGDSFGDDFAYRPSDSSDLELSRRKSTGSRRPRHHHVLHDENSDDEMFQEIILKRKDKDASHKKGSENHRPRSSSNNDPNPVLLTVPSRHHHRSKSQQTPHHESSHKIIYLADDQPPRHRSDGHSHSRSPHPVSDTGSDLEVIKPERRRRDSSTHSYVREREGEPGRRRSTSRGRHGEVVDRRKLVTKMDRIDSMPIDKS